MKIVRLLDDKEVQSYEIVLTPCVLYEVENTGKTRILKYTTNTKQFKNGISKKSN